MNTKTIALNDKELQEFILALGNGISLWGSVNLLNGYEQDDPELQKYGMQQILAGGSVCALAYRIRSDDCGDLPD